MFKTLLVSGLIASGLAAPGMIFNCGDNLQGKRPCIPESALYSTWLRYLQQHVLGRLLHSTIIRSNTEL